MRHWVGHRRIADGGERDDAFGPKETNDARGVDVGLRRASSRASGCAEAAWKRERGWVERQRIAIEAMTVLLQFHGRGGAQPVAKEAFDIAQAMMDEHERRCAEDDAADG